MATLSADKRCERLALDPGTIRKYDRPVPRYTSYPTALRFKSVEDGPSRSALLADLEGELGPLSLYVHLPYCRSLCWFCGCAKVVSTDTTLADRYLDYLEKELRLYAGLLKKDRQVVQLHFGGGSPNFLTPAQIRRLGEMLRAYFAFEPHAEISVELDPRTLTEGQVEAFAYLGVNRASIGVQDINPQVQKAIHRIQPSETNRRALQWLRESGIRSVNIDLIYGLPYQTCESFRATLDEVLDYAPDRLAIFSYAHVPWSKPAQKILERTSLPTSEAKIEILIETVRTLTDRSYVHVGMDHFAKPSDPLVKAQSAGTLQRNFQGYSLHANVDICAFGMSAISQTKNVFRQNYKNLDTYYTMLDAGEFPLERGYLLTRDDQVRREVIMRLMCDLKLDYGARGKANGIEFEAYFQRELTLLDEMEADGLVLLTGDGLEVTALGRLLIRNLASCFDAYSQASTGTFSRAI